MGCDIHIYSEHRKDKDSSWLFEQADTRDEEEEDSYLYFEQFEHTGRDYWFFGFLSDGVRCSFNESFPKKGIPEDASTEYNELVASWDGDGHSHSYLSLKELLDKQHDLIDYKVKALLNSAITSPEAMDHNCRRLDDIILLLKEEAEFHGITDTENSRIVFFFDN